jgi:glycosyltransferase involved in cell wall biosynthesis
MIGNIQRWKGQNILIDALAIVRTRFPSAVGLLIGDISDTVPEDRQYYTEIKQQISSLNLEGSVVIAGYRKNVPGYLRSFCLAVHASVMPEPFGRVLLDAMAVEKPIVASRAGGVIEIVCDGETGLLFEAGNAQDLADKICTLLGEADLARMMGIKGRKRLENKFSAARTARRTQLVYQFCFANRRGNILNRASRYLRAKFGMPQRYGPTP